MLTPTQLRTALESEISRVCGEFLTEDMHGPALSNSDVAGVLEDAAQVARITAEREDRNAA